MPEQEDLIDASPVFWLTYEKRCVIVYAGAVYMALLDDIIMSLAETAHWKLPRCGEDGAYRIRLEGDLDIAFFSPDGRRCVMRTDLVPVPVDGAERNALLRAVAERQAGICRERASIVALEVPGQSLLQDSVPGERLILYRMVDLDTSQEIFTASVRDFLNDAAWWKASFKETPCGREAASLFSMPNRVWGGVH